MAFLPSSRVTGVISDRGTIGKWWDQSHHSTVTHLLHASAQLCRVPLHDNRAVHPPLSSRPCSRAVTTLASMSHSMRQPFDPPFISTAHCHRLTTVMAWCGCLLRAPVQNTWPTNDWKWQQIYDLQLFLKLFGTTSKRMYFYWQLCHPYFYIKNEFNDYVSILVSFTPLFWFYH